jgi:hypothetical protein
MMVSGPRWTRAILRMTNVEPVIRRGQQTFADGSITSGLLVG